jgi:hypothetical protein
MCTNRLYGLFSDAGGAGRAGMTVQATFTRAALSGLKGGMWLPATADYISNSQESEGRYRQRSTRHPAEGRCSKERGPQATTSEELELIHLLKRVNLS